MTLGDRLGELNDRVLGQVPTPGSPEDKRRRRRLYVAVVALIAAVVLFSGLSGGGYFTLFTEDAWGWLLVLPCVLILVVRSLRRGRRRSHRLR